MGNNKLNPGQPVQLANLIEYVDDAVVSKEIMKKPSGTVTLFAFTAGQGLSEHSAPFDVLVQVLEGNAELVIDGQSIHTQAGETVIMPANIPHAVKANEKFKMLLVMLKK